MRCLKRSTEILSSFTWQLVPFLPLFIKFYFNGITLKDLRHSNGIVLPLKQMVHSGSLKAASAFAFLMENGFQLCLD